MKRVNAIAVSILLLVFAGAGASAAELRIGIGTQDEALEKINFEVAVEAAKNGQTAEERNVVLSAQASNLPEYERGDFYYLNGNLGDEWTYREWDQFYGIAKWLIRSRFRVIMNPIAKGQDVREATQNPRTSVIIWSSHGSNVGELFDADNNVVPKDAFSFNASKMLHQIILSNCHGETTVQYYSFPDNVKIKHWIGLSTTKDLYDYLLSDQWNEDLLTD